MTCREAESLVMDYIHHNLEDWETESFIAHIEFCEACREELEIYYMVDVGLKQLDTGMGTYNIKGALEAALDQSKLQVRSRRLFMVFRYAVDTLAVIAVLLTILIQLRVWYQIGT